MIIWRTCTVLEEVIGRFEIANTILALELIAELRVIYHMKENFSEIRMSSQPFVYI